MALQFSPVDILHATAIQDVEQSLGDFALELALLGEIGLARELVSLVSSRGRTVRPNPIDKAMVFAWSVTSQYPDGTEDKAAQREADRSAQRALYDGQWGKVPEESRQYNEEGLKVCLDDTVDGRSPKHPEGITLEHADATTGWIAMLKGERLTKALDISVRLNCARLLERDDDTARLSLRDLDETTASIAKKVAARWNANQAKRYLARAEILWPLYSRGLFADALGLPDDEVKNTGEKIISVFRDRLESGFAETQLSAKSMRELVEIGNRFSVQKRDKHAEDQTSLSTTPFSRNPATADDVAQLESRLGVALPEDYKEFLSISNGFGEPEVGMFNGYGFGPELYETSRIEWITKAYFELPVDLLDIGHLHHELSSKKQYTTDDMVWSTPLPLFDRVLEIGYGDIDHVWLVQPELVQKSREAYEELYSLANNEQKFAIDRAIESFVGSWEAFRKLEWCCATWAAGGSASFHAFRSFRQYLEEASVSSMEEKP